MWGGYRVVKTFGEVPYNCWNVLSWSVLLDAQKPIFMRSVWCILNFRLSSLMFSIV